MKEMNLIMCDEKISVCMATYNGSKFILNQINSILPQLSAEDEVIIVDDSSKDSTVTILRNIRDIRIKIVVNETNIGVNKSFEKAILLSKNDYIFMADQDDIWTELRVNKMLNILKNKDVNLVSGNSLFINQEGNEIDYNREPLKERDSHKRFKNIGKIFAGSGAYYGCSMAFKKKLKKIILPFPNYIESHDLWIALTSMIQDKSYHLEDNVLYRRIHGTNASIVKRPLIKKLYSRMIFAISVIHILVRLLKSARSKY